MVKIPKLSSNTAAKVEEAEGGNFEAIPEGIYALVLEDVEVKEGPKGQYWSWTFKVAEGEEYAGRKFWNNTSLSDDAFWKLKETFEAFGVSPDTDTDTLIGDRVRAMIVQKIAEKGKRAGELQNEIKTLLPLDPDKAKSAPGVKRSAKADPGDVPIY